MEWNIKKLRTITIAVVALFALLVLFNRNSDDTILVGQMEQLTNNPTVYKSTKKIKKNNTTNELRAAFTGSWFKNDPLPEPSQSFEFKTPENTRNQIAPIAKKNTKKKIAKSKKKTKVTYKLDKKNIPNRKFSGFATTNFDSGIISIPGNFIPRKENDNEKSPEEKLTADQWFELLKDGKDFSKFISFVKSGKISSQIYYEVIQKLIASEDTDHNKIGYRLLGQIPSTANFERHYAYYSEEQEQEIKSFAKQQLNIYKSISNIRILNAMLANGDSSLKLGANEIIRELVEALIASNPQNPPQIDPNDEQSPIRQPSSTINQYRPQLQVTLTIITNALNSGNLDSEVSSQFNQTKDLLTRLLGSSEIITP